MSVCEPDRGQRWRPTFVLNSVVKLRVVRHGHEYWSRMRSLASSSATRNCAIRSWSLNLVRPPFPKTHSRMRGIELACTYFRDLVYYGLE